MLLHLFLEDREDAFERSVHTWLTSFVLVDYFDGIVVFFLFYIEGCFLGKFDVILDSKNITLYSERVFLMPFINSIFFSLLSICC